MAGTIRPLGWGGRRTGRPRSSPKPLRGTSRASLGTRVRVRALQDSRGCRSAGSAAGARVVRPRRLRPFPFPGAGARMAAGTRPAAGPRSRTAMAQWRKKKGLRKRRGAASQARSSDSEDGEFEIQAEDDTRAQKVGARVGTHVGARARAPCGVPRPQFPQLWSAHGRGWEEVSCLGGQGRSAGPSTCPQACHAPEGWSHHVPEAGAFGPSWPAFGRAHLIGYLYPRGGS